MLKPILKRGTALMMALILTLSLTGGVLPAFAAEDEDDEKVTTEVVEAGDESVKPYSAAVVDTDLLSSHTDKTSELDKDTEPDYPTGDATVSLSCAPGLYDDLGFDSAKLTESAHSIAADENNQNILEGYSFIAPQELIITAVNRSKDHEVFMQTWNDAAATDPNGLNGDMLKTLMNDRKFIEGVDNQTRNGVGIDIDGDGIDEFAEMSLYAYYGDSRAVVELFTPSNNEWTSQASWEVTMEAGDDYVLRIEAPQSKGYTAMVAGNFDHSADGSEELAVYIPDKDGGHYSSHACVKILRLAPGSITELTSIYLKDIYEDYGKMGVDWQLPTVSLSTCSLRLGDTPVSTKGTDRYWPYTDLAINVSVPPNENRGRSMDGKQLTLNSTTAICEFDTGCKVSKMTCFMYEPSDKKRMAAVNSCEADLNGDGYKELVVAGVEEYGLGDNNGTSWGSYSNSKSLLNIIYYTGSEYKLVWAAPKEVDALGTLDPGHFDSLEPVALCAARFDPTSPQLQDQLCVQGVFLRCDGANISGSAAYIQRDQNNNVDYCVIPNTARYQEAANFPDTVTFTNLNDGFNPANAVGADGSGAWIDASYAGYFLTASGTACAVHITTDERNGEHDKVYFDYQIVSLVSDVGGNLSCVTKTWNDYIDSQDEDDDGTCMYGCFLNCDDDAFYYRYTGTYTSYSTPVLFSVIQAPPYYSEANSVEGISFSITSSIANNSEIDVGGGFHLKFSITAKLPFFKTGSSIDVGADAAYSYAWSYNKTVSHTLGLRSDRDYAVVYVVPILANTYELLPSGKESEPEYYEIDVPLQPIFTPLTIEQYNAALTNNQEHSDTQLPSDTSAPIISADMLAKSTPGDPTAYAHTLGDIKGVSKVGSFDTDKATDYPGVAVNTNIASAGSSIALGSSIDNSGSLIGHISYGFVIGIESFGTGGELTPEFNACFGGGGGRTKANDVSYTLTYKGLATTLPDNLRFSKYDSEYSGSRMKSQIIHYDPAAAKNALSYNYTSTAVAYPLNNFAVDLETITGIDTRPFKDDTVYELSYYTTDYSNTPEPAENFTLQDVKRDGDGNVDITLAWDSTVRNESRKPYGYNLYMLNAKSTDIASRTLFLQNTEGPIRRNPDGSYTNYTVHLQAGDYSDSLTFYLVPLFRSVKGGVLTATEGILDSKYELTSLDTLLGGSVQIIQQPETAWLNNDDSQETVSFQVTAQKDNTLTRDMLFDWQTWDREAQTWNSVTAGENGTITSGADQDKDTDSTTAFTSVWTRTVEGKAAKDALAGVPVRCVVTCGNNEVNSSKTSCEYLKDPNLQITSVPSKVYDGTPAAEPSVKTDSTGDVTFTWYQDGQALSGAPTDAGSYTVRASVAEAAPYAAGQAEATVTISPATTSVVLSAVQDGTSGQATATIGGLLEADGSVTFTITKDGASTTSDPVPVTEQDGAFQATLTDARMAAGTYTVQASYTSDSGNYSAAQAEQTFTKNGVDRTVTVSVPSYEKNYGDEGWSLTDSLSASVTTDTDQWSFQVVSDTFQGYAIPGEAAPATVSVDQNGQVTVNHAGTAMIQAALSDTSGVYNDATACVTVTVKPVPLTVTAKAEPASAAYGTLDQVSYTLSYDGLVNDDTGDTFTHGYGTLSAVPVAADADASDTPYPVKIAENGTTVTMQSKTYENVFLSRDYTLTLVNGTLTVMTRDLSDSKDILVTKPADVTYNGTEQKQPVTVKTAEGVLLEEGKDYTLAYSGDPDLKSAGSTVTVTVTGIGNYQNYQTTEYKILEKQPDNNGGSSGGGGAAAPASPVSIPASSSGAAAHGSVQSSAANARAGEKVTLTPQPEEGYRLDKLTVTDAKGNVIEVTKNADGTYSFIMPDSKVEIAAVFAEIAEAADGRFVDVLEDAFYAEAVAWAVERGITNGTDETHFSPNAPCTRAHMVTFLWRAAGSPEPAGTDTGFQDVKAGSYYEKAVAWAVEHGVTTGTDETHFSPNAPCTRAHMVTFLWRAAGSPEPAGGSTPFRDVQAGSYYEKAVAWAVENGITNGVDETRFAPGDTVTRAQTVAFLFRYAKASAEGSSSFADVSPEAWYAEAVAWAAEKGITKGVDAAHFAPNDDCVRGQIVTFLYRLMAG